MDKDDAEYFPGFENPFKLRDGCFGDEDIPDFVRASQDAVCNICGQLYRKHPESEHTDYMGYAYLVRLCDGTLVKL